MVRSHLDAGHREQSSADAPAEAGVEVAPTMKTTVSAVSPTPASIGPPQLNVDGGVVATSFTGDGSTLTNLDPANLAGGECEGWVVSGRRYVDRGDGTVRDCNTGRIWLKDASCLGTGPWDMNDGAGSVQAKVADLNSGVDFGCVDYTPGIFTDWVVPPMTVICGFWNGSCTGTSCCTGSDGLVDPTLTGPPAVANGTGDAVWTPGNVFIGVLANEYWSATGDSLNSRGVSLGNGFVFYFSNSSDYNVWPVRDLSP